MRISDWSSDVCSSDLHTFRMLRDRAYQQMVEANPVEKGKVDNRAASLENLYNLAAGKTEPVANPGVAQFFDGLRSLMVASRLGSAVITALSDEGDRKSVVSGKGVSVRVDLGGGRHLQKKNKKK